MIIGIGIDLLLNKRITKLIGKFEKKFLDRIFTKNELADYHKKFGVLKKSNINSINFLAKRYASKEAFSKAVGVGIGRGFDFVDIEIFNDKFGKPHIKIINNKELVVKKILKCKKFNIHLSISDEKTIAVAVVIIEKIL